ncbi:LytTR family DNA-binding domain-containing protein [Streptococcus oriscaviae]|uniref:LytTR family transcriptional regulator n=1 Tax=Streptococcus oriscaviae TaxID=2781599 RepID=A0ABX7YJ18_9STRE|nr:LytTR family DNA-binding domain-containing protein [Streptococcus oriscaviae]QUE53755.1 LytTR family transcriptional regulator [Streptococcus oriscaviae]
MKVRIELDDSLDEMEVIIRAPELDLAVTEVQQALTRLNKPSLVFYKGNSEYFLKLDDLLFFETNGAKIVAHSREDVYEVKMKLYELEDVLPVYFCRISKSTIANSKAVYSLDKSFSGPSRIRFANTHKEVHVSRHYYHLLKEKLQELR